MSGSEKMKTPEKPEILGGYAGKYDIDDVDGKMYMLDHRFSGCYVTAFSKELDERTGGQVLFEGRSVPYVLAKLTAMRNMQLLGICVRDICTEYDRNYTFRLIGFRDMDGNVMEPVDYVITTEPFQKMDETYAEHDAFALKAAEEGIVLLKNENNVLPLASKEHINVVGADAFRISAVGAGKINPRYAVRLPKALEESGFVLDAHAETGIIVISRASGENYDNGAFKGEYYLTDEETSVIKKLKESCRKTVAIINSGYPMDVRFLEEYEIDAAIWCGFPGMLGGRAVVNILNGTVNPSGKLPDTWSNDYYDIPASRNFYMPETPEGALDADHDVWVNTVYEEDIYVGYRYFETFNREVAYPFGYGLSYTDFEIDAALAEDACCDSFVTLRLHVKNTGKTAGKEVVQVYAAIPDGKLEQPSRRLVAFRKTEELQPGETQTIILPIDKNRLTSFDEEESAYIMEAGMYEIYVGNSVRNLKKVCAKNLTQTEVTKRVERYMQPPVEFTRLSKFSKDTYPKGERSGITGLHELSPRASRKHIADTFTEADSFAADWSVEELARLSVCASSGWGMQDTGVAGRMFRLEGRDIPEYAVADGNSGVNINRKNIGMPSSNLVCATWNEQLAYEVGRVIAEEARENGVNMILAPAMNIHRDPLCGRHPEYFSEDPYLAGVMAGNQSKGLEDHGVSCTMKHVCCNGSEAARKRNHSIVSVRALREIYLKAFEVAFEVHKPDSIMTGYNACNGVFTAEDEELIMGIFRKELGFDGFAMTDWNSYDTADIAAAIQAGNCWLTPGSMDDTYTAPIMEGVKNGVIDETRLRQNVRYICRVVKKNWQKIGTQITE